MTVSELITRLQVIAESDPHTEVVVYTEDHYGSRAYIGPVIHLREDTYQVGIVGYDD